MAVPFVKSDDWDPEVALANARRDFGEVRYSCFTVTVSFLVLFFVSHLASPSFSSLVLIFIHIKVRRCEPFYRSVVDIHR